MVVLDETGQLTLLAVIPPRTDSLAVVPEPDWPNWFVAAGLDTGRFAPAVPNRNPSFYVDARRAWRGTRSWAPGDTVLVEAATYRGRLARFSVIVPWDPRDRFNDVLPDGQRTAQSIISFVIILTVMIGGFLITRRNIRLERADRLGAVRVATAVWGSLMLAWLFCRFRSTRMCFWADRP